MGDKSGCFTILNEVFSEKWMAIKRLKRGDIQLAQGVSEVEESQWQKFRPGKMCFLGQFGQGVLE
jgi:predicted negative regulator of RcsB-dependent stress response